MDRSDQLRAAGRIDRSRLGILFCSRPWISVDPTPYDYLAHAGERPLKGRLPSEN